MLLPDIFLPKLSTSHDTIDVNKGRDARALYAHNSLDTAERNARSVASQRSGVRFGSARCTTAKRRV